MVLLGLLALVRFLPAPVRGLAYVVLGLVLWVEIYMAGIHPTLAGVAVALLIPVFAPRRGDVERAAQQARAFRASPNPRYAAALPPSPRKSISTNTRVQHTGRPTHKR